MEILEIKANERVIEIMHPKTDEPIGLKVYLVSFDDEKVKKVRRKFLDEKLRLEARNKHFNAEEIEENNLAMMFAAMTGWEWSNDLTLDGDKQPAFNQKNVYTVLKKIPFVASQIEKEVVDEKAFF